MDVVALNRSLISSVNADGETPLLTATTSGHATLASFLLRCCCDLKPSETILKQDKQGCNALHHAIRRGQRELALELIAAEPVLSRALNKYNESPMFMAVMRNYEDIFEKLLDPWARMSALVCTREGLPGSAHAGAHGYNALHAAVRNNSSAIAKRIMETRPTLAREEGKDQNTPMRLAVLWNKIDVLKVLLEHDRSLGYVVSTNGTTPLLVLAAFRGHVGVAQELLKHCPDAPYCTANGWTCLHNAVSLGHDDFLEFVLGSQQLGKLINMRDIHGRTALQYAIEKCSPRMVRALLRHKDIDVTVLDNTGTDANWTLAVSTDHPKTLNWNEVSMLMLKADPADATDTCNLRKFAKDRMTEISRMNIKSLTETCTGNTSLVATLIAKITFATDFTLPGGYYSDAASDEGQPIMARKLVFKAFLISDTLAMCSSLAVAFVCILARWEDLEFLLYYRSFTKKLMWFADMATTTAFATGLYMVLAPRLLWLAIAICILSVSLPIFTKLLGEWPVLKLKFRLGRTCKSELLDMD
ncbi:hypothetical protein EJB05_28568, partial [Eragrostis curvula]